MKTDVAKLAPLVNTLSEQEAVALAHLFATKYGWNHWLLSKAIVPINETRDAVSGDGTKVPVVRAEDPAYR